MRYLTNPLIARIQAVLTDNTAGAITPAILRGLLIDMVESLRTTGSYMLRNTDLAYNFTDNTYRTIANLFTSGETRDATEIEINVPAQTFTAKFAADYEATVSVTCLSASNETVDLAIGINGVPAVFFRADAAMEGTAAPVSVNMAAFVSLQLNDVVTLMVASRNAPSTVTFTSAGMIFQLLPTRGV